jgi:hypothetical protein
VTNVKVHKPVTVEEYNWHMSSTGKEERIIQTSMWIKKYCGVFAPCKNS